MGLPPVGAVCEVKSHNNAWGFSASCPDVGWVVAYDGEEFWWKNSGGFKTISRTDKVEFRPIQTEAEKERERLIKDAKSLINSLGCDAAYYGDTDTVIAELFVDAKWRPTK